MIVQFKKKTERYFKDETRPYTIFEYLFAQIKFAEGCNNYATELAKKSYEKIFAESNVAILKKLSDGRSLRNGALLCNETFIKTATITKFLKRILNLRLNLCSLLKKIFCLKTTDIF